MEVIDVSPLWAIFLFSLLHRRKKRESSSLQGHFLFLADSHVSIK